MASRLGRGAVDGDVRDVCGCAGRDDFLHRVPRVVDDGDGGAHVQIGVVDSVLGNKGREDEQLGGGRYRV